MHTLLLSKSEHLTVTELNSSLKISPTPAVPSIRKKNVPSQTSAVFSPKLTHSSGPLLVHIWKISFWPMYTTPNWIPLQKKLRCLLWFQCFLPPKFMLHLLIFVWVLRGEPARRWLWHWSCALTTEIEAIHCLLVLFLLLCKYEVDATQEDKALKATSQNQNCWIGWHLDVGFSVSKTAG